MKNLVKIVSMSAVALAILGSPAYARDGDRDGDRHEWRGHEREWRPAYYRAPRLRNYVTFYNYAPPPVYYYPQPQPVYYAPPVYPIGFFGFRF